VREGCKRDGAAAVCRDAREVKPSSRMVDSAALYRWSQRIGELVPRLSDRSIDGLVSNTEELKELSAEIYEAYLEALRAEIASKGAAQ
jgi:hypothetical protein